MNLLTNGGDPRIVTEVNVNGENMEMQNPIRVMKDTWSRLCVGIDWTNRYVGKY